MPRRLLAIAVLAGAALLLPASGALAAHTTKVRVMTRNLFLGTDLPPIAAAPAGARFEQAAGRGLAEVEAGDPAGRMKLVAGEIAKSRADLVGLQEVSLWRTGPKGDPAPATNVLVDYLKVIRRQLWRLGQHYRVAAREQGLNVEGPTDRGVDIRLTLGDVVLVRRGVKIRHSRSGIFRHQLIFPTTQLGDVNPSRSWNAVDVTVRGARIHFVNTHLEAYATSFRLEQARELVHGPLKHGGTTILAGDLNSGPTLSNPDDRPPYKAIRKAGLRPKRTSRDSCCFDSILTGAGGWTHNVDWIMTRPNVRLVRSYRTGRERTSGGVYPSDHGGVVSVLRVRR
jgi:endonuclease/exonuclease/phosphatase family metal-dependent hydrolase